MNFDIKKLYLYIVCAVALFIALWGVIDFLGAGISLFITRAPISGAPTPGPEASMDEYYQQRMLLDRLVDSGARLIIPGAVFLYFSLKLKKLEG
jgi:hypothetical protein